MPDWDAESSVSSGGGGSDGSNGGGGSGGKTSTSIPAHLYIQRVVSLHAEGNLGFANEFQMVQSLSAQEDFAAEAAHLPDNRSKNRYPNVVACKHITFNESRMPRDNTIEFWLLNELTSLQH